MEKKIQKISAFVILLSAALLGLEATFRIETTLIQIFDIIDIFIIAYFFFEILYRLRTVKNSFSTFLLSVICKFKFKSSDDTVENHEEVIEEWLWIIFDLFLVVLSILSFFRHFFDHPQLILILRMFRIFRIFRVFELNDSLKSIEKKIISVVPTIMTFFFLIILLLYTYAIVGMHLYDFKKFDSIDFSGVYAAMISLFILMTNGWSDILTELREVENVAVIITDIYVISFFLFSVIVTLNVFLAVMTSQIQEKLESDIKEIKKTEEEIQSELADMEKESVKDNDLILQKIELIMKELESIKNSNKN